MAYMLGNLGAIMLQQGGLVPARRYLEESLDLHEKIGDQHGTVAFLIRLAEVAVYQDEPDEAYSLATRCLSVSQQAGYRWYSALALYQLAQVATVRGQYEQAQIHLVEAFRLCEETPNNVEGVIVALEGFAELAAAQNQVRLALSLYSAAVARRHANHLSLPPVNRLREERIIGLVRMRLHKADFAAVWVEGLKASYWALLEAQINPA